MNYDIVPIKNHYRGMGRLLLATDLYTKQAKKEYDVLLGDYYKYLSIIQQSPSSAGLTDLVNLCKKFLQYGIKCEMIVYDNTPIQTFFGYDLEFLGVDITHEMSESLLYECDDYGIRKFLNQNGLCATDQYLNCIVLMLDHGDVKWDPCYVYKIKC